MLAAEAKAAPAADAHSMGRRERERRGAIVTTRAELANSRAAGQVSARNAQ